MLSGHAAFAVEDEEIDTPAGTLVFVSEHGARCGAVAVANGAAALVVGVPPDTIVASAWEH